MLRHTRARMRVHALCLSSAQMGNVEQNPIRTNETIETNETQMQDVTIMALSLSTTLCIYLIHLSHMVLHVL